MQSSIRRYSYIDQFVPAVTLFAFNDNTRWTWCCTIGCRQTTVCFRLMYNVSLFLSLSLSLILSLSHFLSYLIAVTMCGRGSIEYILMTTTLRNSDAHRGGRCAVARRCCCRQIFLYIFAVVLVHNFVVLLSLKPSTRLADNDIRPVLLPPFERFGVVRHSSVTMTTTTTTTTTSNPEGMSEKLYYRRRPTKVAQYRHNIVVMPAAFCRKEEPSSAVPGSSWLLSFFLGGGRVRGRHRSLASGKRQQACGNSRDMG